MELMQTDNLSICDVLMPVYGSLILICDGLKLISGGPEIIYGSRELVYGAWAFIYGAPKSCGNPHKAFGSVQKPSNRIRETFEFTPEAVQRTRKIFGPTLLSVCTNHKPFFRIRKSSKS